MDKLPLGRHGWMGRLSWEMRRPHENHLEPSAQHSSPPPSLSSQSPQLSTPLFLTKLTAILGIPKIKVCPLDGTS